MVERDRRAEVVDRHARVGDRADEAGLPGVERAGDDDLRDVDEDAAGPHRLVESGLRVDLGFPRGAVESEVLREDDAVLDRADAHARVEGRLEPLQERVRVGPLREERRRQVELAQRRGDAVEVRLELLRARVVDERREGVDDERRAFVPSGGLLEGARDVFHALGARHDLLGLARSAHERGVGVDEDELRSARRGDGKAEFGHRLLHALGRAVRDRVHDIPPFAQASVRELVEEGLGLDAGVVEEEDGRAGGHRLEETLQLWDPQPVQLGHSFVHPAARLATDAAAASARGTSSPMEASERA